MGFGVWGLGLRVWGGEGGDGQRPGIAGRIHVHVPVSLPLPGEMRGDATNLSFFLTEGGEELAALSQSDIFQQAEEASPASFILKFRR